MLLWLRWSKKVSALSEGAVAVVKGKVVVDKGIRVPHAGGTCAFYDLLTETFGTGMRGRGRPLWLPQKVERRCTSFAVDDGSGRIWVEARDETIDASGGVRTSGVIGKKGRERYTVLTIRDGDTVKVRGLVSKARPGEGGCDLAIRPDAKGRIEVMFVRSGSAPRAASR